MLLNKLARWVVAMVCVAGLWGCAKKAPPQETTKTAAEYKTEADKQIDEKNADAELTKLEQSVNQDAAAQ